jgi:hypothetical protein
MLSHQFNTLGITLLAIGFSICSSQLLHAVTSLWKKFFSTMVDFRLYDIKMALVEVQVDADNAKPIEDHVQVLQVQHTASYLSNHFNPIGGEHCCRPLGYGASLVTQ